ncbi:MAG: hypothetical protein CMJ83_17385, partial [Planctomycetes bacterium]|nr:hypothetical protein [Planctomycetota bacterium]
RPFASATAAEVIYKKLHEEPVAPRRVDSDIPRDLETVVLTAMAREPDRRYATAGRLADDLERFLDRRPIEARRRGVFGRMGLWCRRNPALAASIFVGVVVSGSIAAVGLNEVLHERDLAREQRDAAHDHLYRSLVNEAAARVAAKETAWRSRVLDNLRRAATSPSSTRDPVELRTLAAKCFSQRQPSFRMLGKWSTEHGFPTALAWSPDGSLIAIARRDGQVDLRDAETGVNRAQCIGAERAVYGLAFHPGGRWLVAGGFDGRLRFYDVTEVDEESAGGSTELAAVKTVAAEGYSFTTLSWSPDGTRLAAGIGHQSARCPVFLFTMHGDTLPAGVEEVGAPKGTLPLVSKTRQLAGHTRAINCVAFSADGLQLGTGGRDSAVSVWEVETGRLQGVWSVSDPPRAIVSVGRTWVASTLENAGCLVITPGNTPPLVNRPGLHDGGVSRILRMPQGWLLTCGDDGLLQCWDSRLNPLGVARGRSGALRTLAVSPDGARVIAGARDHLQMWAVDASDGSDTMSTGHVARFVPGTRTLVTSTTVRDFDDDGPGRSRYLTAPGLRGIHAAGSAHVVVLRRDGKLQIMAARGESRLVEVDGGLVRDLVVEAAGEQAIAVMEDESVVVLRLPDAEVVARRVPATPVQAVAWAGSDQIIIADDRGVELRDAMLENPRPILPGPRRNMRLAGTTDRIAVAATAQEALVINLGDAKIQQRLTTSDVASLSWLDDDAWLAVCEPDRVRLFDGQTWEARTYLAARPIEPKWVALDVDAGLLVTGGTYATLVVWDFEEQYEILELHVRATTNAAFVRDGRALIAASQLGAATGWTRRTLLAAARRMRRAHDDGVATSPPRPTPDVTLISGGHVSQVWATAPSPDGIHVATGSHDGVVKLWSLNGDRPELLKDLRGHRSIAWCTTFSNDGRWLFSGSGEVIRWDVEKRVESMRLPSRRSLVAGITAHPSEPWIAFGRLDGRLEIWRYDEEQSARVLKGPGPGNLRQIAITRDGRRLAVAAGDAGLFLYDLMTPEFRAWLSGASVVPPAPTKRVASPHGASIDAVTWSPDATRLVIGDIEGHVVVTDAATHTRWVTLQTVPTAVRSLDYDQTGRYLAAGIGSASATTWDFDRLQRLWRELGIDP